MTTNGIIKAIQKLSDEFEEYFNGVKLGLKNLQLYNQFFLLNVNFY